MRSTWIKVGPKSNDKCSYKGKEEKTRGESNVNTEVGTEAMCL